MQASGVFFSLGGEAVKKQPVPFLRPHGEPFHPTFRSFVWSVLGFVNSIWEEGFSTFFGCVNVHEHGCNTLSTVLWPCVLAVVEVIVVRIVLLSDLVSQDLQRLSVFHRNHGYVCDPSFDPVHDFVLCFSQERSVAGPDGARHASTGFAVHDGGRLQRGHAQLLQVFAFVFGEQLLVQERTWFPRQPHHLATPRGLVFLRVQRASAARAMLLSHPSDQAFLRLRHGPRHRHQQRRHVHRRPHRHGDVRRS
mmetsp:Transcript_8471/g.52934  ORF Transcript_8471/g.52934 Transcript_8471/m.52934 type:complete len:250 (+) Transcript_8471:174-923(+)